MLHLQIFTFNFAAENTYVLYNDAKEAWLIDPGNMHENETQLLGDFIRDKDLNVEKILLTHAHVDHVIGLQWAVDTYKVPVYLHPEEEEVLEMLPMSANRYGFFVPPVQANLIKINEGDELQLGDEKFVVLHIPGHSPGSIVFYSEKEKFMISGDVLFEGSIGRTDLFKGNYEQLISAIQQKLLPLAEDTQVLPGHGNATTLGFEKHHNPFLQ